MKVFVKKIEPDKQEVTVIQCHEVTEEIKDIVRFIKTSDSSLTGYVDECINKVPLQDVFFIESVDNRVFAYTLNKVYELKCKLYEFVSQYENKMFFRCSKSLVVNLMKIDNVRPALNGRFSARLFNGEEIIISRQYVPELKRRLLGD